MTKQQKQLLLVGGALAAGYYIMKQASQPQMVMPAQPAPGVGGGGSLLGKLGELIGGVIQGAQSKGAKPRTPAGTAPPPISTLPVPKSTLSGDGYGTLGGCTLGCSSYGSLG